jgi:hypothetical protein
MVPKALKLPPLRVLQDPQAESLTQADREELQVKSLAAFAWRALEALRDAWSRVIPGGRVELVMYDYRKRCGYILGKPHIETMPFPWPERMVRFYFYLPGTLCPLPMAPGREHQRAVADDGVSVRPAWVQECLDAVLTSVVFGKG